MILNIHILHFYNLLACECCFQNCFFLSWLQWWRYALGGSTDAHTGFMAADGARWAAAAASSS